MKRICVFCGSSFGSQEAYGRAAKNLGQLLVSEDLELVYGGSNIGLMGELARSVLEQGGRAIGVIPELLYANVEHLEVTRLYVVKDMHQRKAKMYELSDGFIALPGGIGTLEEIFEVFTWGQLGYHRKPVGLLNVEGYYNKLLDSLTHMVAEGFLKSNHLKHLLVEEQPYSLLARFTDYKHQMVEKWAK